MNYLYLTGTFCYTQKIDDKDYYVSLFLGEENVQPAYDFMLSMNELQERIPGVVTYCLKNNGAGQASICVIEYLAQDGATLIQLKHLHLTVEQLHERVPESLYQSIPILSYDEFMRIIEDKCS